MIYESEYAWAVISPDLIKEIQCQNMHKNSCTQAKGSV